MKLLVLATKGTALAAAFVAFSVSAQAKGNGLPSVSMNGSFLLNIHAVDKCPKAEYKGSNRHTIVVQGLTDDDFDDAVNAHGNNVPDSWASNDIWLTPNEESADSFVVVDGNACDGDGAEFAMPPLVATTYDVFLKMVGKPGGKANPVLCARDLYTDEITGDFYCNTGTVHVRTKGKNTYVNVNDELLNILYEEMLLTFVFRDPDGDYFWDWSATTGAKAQVRFVPKS